MGCRSAVELVEVSVQVRAAGPGGLDHDAQAIGLRFEGLDLPLDAAPGILEDRPTLPGVLRGAEPLSVALAGGLVLEELADLGEREAGVVAQLLDVAQPLQVRGVVQPIRALGPAAGSRRPTSS